MIKNLLAQCSNSMAQVVLKDRLLRCVLRVRIPHGTNNFCMTYKNGFGCICVCEFKCLKRCPTLTGDLFYLMWGNVFFLNFDLLSLIICYMFMIIMFHRFKSNGDDTTNTFNFVYFVCWNLKEITRSFDENNNYFPKLFCSRN